MFLLVDFLSGFVGAAIVGAGGLYTVLFIFALMYPRLFRVFWWSIMLPIMTFGGAFLMFIPAAFMFGFNSNTFFGCCVAGFFFPGLTFCKAIDPRITSNE